MNPLLTQWLAEPGRSKASEVALMIGIPCFLAIAIFGFGYSREKDGGHPMVKYFGFIPLLVSMVMGWPYFSYARDPFAQKTGLIGGSSYYAYLAAFLGPLVLLIVLSLLVVVLKRFIDNESRL